jgi:hypothetical protein
VRSNLILLAFSFAFVAMAGSFHINYLDYEKPIAYSNWKTITWSNFRGNNTPYRTLKGHREFGFIETDIVIDNDDDSLYITSYFYPSRSYVFNKRIIDRPFLKHELLHFHITEYHARLLRRQVIDGFNSNTPIDVDDMLDDINAEEAIMQQQYDEETDHGLLVGKQKKWQLRIDSLLLSQNEVKSNSLLIREK